MSKTKVVILCGGKGTRLREETEFRPKPMIEIGGRPILWHIMKIYAFYGFTDFVLCIGYKGEVIKNYFLNYEAMNSDFTICLGRPNQLDFYSNHSEKDWSITIADTGEDTMTGARVKQIEKYIDADEFMLTYGDGVADIDINKLIEFHHSTGKIGTVTGVQPQLPFGKIIHKDGQVKKFSEKPKSTEGYINGGFFVFNRDFFKYLSSDSKCILERKPLEKLSKERNLSMNFHSGYWNCMDTYQDYLFLNNLWDKGEAYWKVWE